VRERVYEGKGGGGVLLHILTMMGKEGMNPEGRPSKKRLPSTEMYQGWAQNRFDRGGPKGKGVLPGWGWGGWDPGDRGFGGGVREEGCTSSPSPNATSLSTSSWETPTRCKY